MYKLILVPIDINHESSWKKVLPMAVSLASMGNTSIHAISVVPNFGMSIVGLQFPAKYSENITNEVSKELSRLLKKEIPAGITQKTHVRHGTIYKEILNTANYLECDLIMMSSYRTEMKDYLLGPNAGRVVRHARQSVFVIR